VSVAEIKDKKSGRGVFKKGLSQKLVCSKESGPAVPQMYLVVSVVVGKGENSDLEVLGGSVFGVEFS
jgi:hypothetical protein